ncbi:uncharacterized protein ACIBXB_019345 isoform 2-T2 [Morphnus guianensis]
MAARRDYGSQRAPRPAGGAAASPPRRSRNAPRRAPLSCGRGARAAGVASAEPEPKPEPGPGRRGRAAAPGGRPARRGAPRLHLRRLGTPPGRGQRPMCHVGMSFGVTSGWGGGGPEKDGFGPNSGNKIQYQIWICLCLEVYS